MHWSPVRDPPLTRQGRALAVVILLLITTSDSIGEGVAILLDRMDAICISGEGTESLHSTLVLIFSDITLTTLAPYSFVKATAV